MADVKSKDNSLDSQGLNTNVLERAIFSSQYKRRIFIKHWFFTKRGASIVLLLIALYFLGFLNSWVFSIVVLVSLRLYLKDDTLSHSREKTVWLLVKIREFIKMLEQSKKDSDKKRVNEDFINKTFEECRKK